MNIRKLRADEIDCRAQIVKENGCSLLLYKDARADMKILDEVFGPKNWQREHIIINDNLFCNVKIWDEDKKQWIVKQDVGVESRTEKEKGQASDAFKRACFNVGIGRELYTAPFIWIDLNKSELYQKNKSWRLKSKVNFEVNKIEYEEEVITYLEIRDQDGNIRFKMGEYTKAPGEGLNREKVIKWIKKWATEKPDINEIVDSFMHEGKKKKLKELNDDNLKILANKIKKDLKGGE